MKLLPARSSLGPGGRQRPCEHSDADIAPHRPARQHTRGPALLGWAGGSPYLRQTEVTVTCPADEAPAVWGMIGARVLSEALSSTFSTAASSVTPCGK